MIKPIMKDLEIDNSLKILIKIIIIEIIAMLIIKILIKEILDKIMIIIYDNHKSEMQSIAIIELQIIKVCLILVIKFKF